MRRIIIIIITAIILSSCTTFYNNYSYNNRVSHPTYIKYLLFLPNRILDLLDVFRLNVGIGPGIGVNIRATRFAQVGIASYDCIKIGIIGRQGWIYMEESKEFGVSVMYIEDSKAVGPLISFKDKTDRQPKKLFPLIYKSLLLLATRQKARIEGLLCICLRRITRRWQLYQQILILY